MTLTPFEVVVVDLGGVFDEEHAAKRRLKTTNIANARHGRPSSKCIDEFMCLMISRTIYKSIRRTARWVPGTLRQAGLRTHILLSRIKINGTSKSHTIGDSAGRYDNWCTRRGQRGCIRLAQAVRTDDIEPPQLI